MLEKMIYGLILFTAVSLAATECRGAELILQTGNGYKRQGERWSSQRDMYGVRLSYGVGYVQVNHIDINGTALGIGLRARQYSPRVRLIESLGVDYLQHTDRGYITGAWQYHLYFGADFFIGRRWFVGAGIAHDSNCKHICKKLYQVDGPNIGLDWSVLRFGVKL